MNKLTSILTQLAKSCRVIWATPCDDSYTMKFIVNGHKVMWKGDSIWINDPDALPDLYPILGNPTDDLTWKF